MEDPTQKEDGNAYEAFERANRLLSEAVEAANIKDFSEYRHTPEYYARYWAILPEDIEQAKAPDRPKWEGPHEMYKMTFPNNTILLLQIRMAPYSIAWLEISMFEIAFNLLQTATRLLNQTENAIRFELKTPKDREEAIDRSVKRVLHRYFVLLPILATKGINQTIDDSIKGYIKIEVEPHYQDKWQELGFPKNFEAVSVDFIRQYQELLESSRKKYSGDHRTDIPPDVLQQLPAEYEGLRKQYRDAKKQHNRTRKIFMAASNRNNNERWREKWEQDGEDLFPELYFDCLMLISEDATISPRELSYKHLGLKYLRRPSYMKKIIEQQKKLALEKAARKKR